jgi:hypothetical protein
MRAPISRSGLGFCGTKKEGLGMCVECRLKNGIEELVLKSYVVVLT